MNLKLSTYFSHQIRGQKGKDATNEDMDRNCRKALEAVEWLRRYFPAIDIYVPAESEPFVQLAYDMKYLNEEQILEIDCKILEQKDFLIVLREDGWVGGGIGVEIRHAESKNVPIFYLDTDKLNWDTLRELYTFIDVIINKKMSKKR